MGRRSRKRRAATTERPAGLVPPAGAPEVRRPVGASQRPLPGDPPRPPWHPFPLAELCIFVALILGVVGLIVWGRRGQAMIGGALVLTTAATLEFTLREHLAGFRSHSTLLAGLVAVASGAGLFVLGLPRSAVIVVGAGVFAAALLGFRELFKRRSGGAGWRGGWRP